MESKASPKPFSATRTKPATQTPLKPSPSVQIETPEKPFGQSRRATKRSVAFSVKEVKRVALGLQKTDKKPIDQANTSGSGNDLLSTEEQVGADSGASRARKHSKGKAPVKLPEKYEILHKFFSCMETSIRLVRLRGKVPNFSTICPLIENLTDRRFTFGHLSQMKYILPEAISIQKVLVRDETTCCMKPDIQITLQLDAFSTNRGKNHGTGYSILSKIFRDRLVLFSKGHPEEDSIPEEDLPEPFNQMKLNIVAELNFSQQQLAVPSHMSPSFRRMFSQKALMPAIAKTPASCENASMEIETPVHASSSFINIHSKTTVSKDSSLYGSPIKLPPGSSQVTREEARNPAKFEYCSPKETNISMETPAKPISTPILLMTTTPNLQTPKRCHQNKDKDYTSEDACMRRRTRTKLFLTPVKKAKVNVEETESVVDDATLRFLPSTLLQSVMEKERKTIEDREAGVSEAKRRQRMICCLPKLFDMILLIFQSSKRSVITKQELVHKIIAGHLDIVDRSEVEEQLKLLQELAPDWISGKETSSGDSLMCINKISSPESVRQTLQKLC